MALVTDGAWTAIVGAMVLSMPRRIPFAALLAFAIATTTGMLPAQGKAASVTELLARIAAAKGAEHDAAAQELAALGGKAVPALRRVLEDGEDAQRIVALFAVGKMGKAAEPLLPVVSKLWLLERIAVTQAIEACFLELGAVGVPELARCVAVFSMQGPACHVLAQIGPPGKPAVPALCKLLSSRTASAHTAASTLGAIRDPAAIPFLVKAVTEGAENPRGCDGSKVANSAQALGKFGAAAAAAVPALVKVMQADVSITTMCDRAATALGDIGVRTEPVLAALNHAAKNRTGDVQRAAKESLEVLECDVGSSDAAIGRAIGHRNPDLQLRGLQRAVERAAKGSVFVAAIVHCYERTDDIAVRLAAIGALGAIGLQDEHVTRVLDAAAKHPDAKLAAAAQEVRAKLDRKD